MAEDNAAKPNANASISNPQPGSTEGRAGMRGAGAHDIVHGDKRL